MNNDKDTLQKKTPTTNTAASVSSWTQLAARGTLATLALRLLSFVCTQWTVRVLNPQALGRASIPLELLMTTVLFLSREGFRLTLTQKTTALHHDDDDDEDNNNNNNNNHATAKQHSRTAPKAWWAVAWLSVPVGTVLSIAALFVHLRYHPQQQQTGSIDDDNYIDVDYRRAGILYCLACWIELWGEPAALYCLYQFRVTAKVSAESIATVSKTIATVLFLQLFSLNNNHHTWPVSCLGMAQVVYAVVYTTSLWIQTLSTFTTTTITTAIRLKTVQDWWNNVDSHVCYLTLIFTLQGCFKHFLTEGDRIVLTALADDYNQGVYAMGSAYGGLAARILFQPIEENCRLLWSRLIQEEEEEEEVSAGTTKESDNQNQQQQQQQSGPSKLETSYTMVIKFVLYVGFVFSCLAVNYTQVVLNLLAGRKWGHNAEAIQVLSAFCIYTALLAWNGCTEAFVYACCCCTGRDIGRLSAAHTMVGLVFAITAPVAVRHFGTVGLVAVNGLTMFLRCLYSVYNAAHYFAHRRRHHQGSSNNNSIASSSLVGDSLIHLVQQMFPHPLVVTAFVGAYFVTRHSRHILEITAMERGMVVGSIEWFKLSLQHLGVGISCVIVISSMAFSLERGFFWLSIRRMTRTNQKE